MDKLLAVLNSVMDRAVDTADWHVEQMGITYAGGKLTLTAGSASIAISDGGIIITAPKITINGETKLNGKEIETK